LGYYAAALNNGALIFTTFDPLFVPDTTAEWFFRFPLFSASGTSAVADVPGRAEIVFLNFANPEFNNTSGIFAPMNDFGAVGGIVVWILLGLLTGRLFVGFTSGRLMSMLLFPSWMTGVYELLRIFYWGGPRYFPILAVVPLISWLLAHLVIRQPSASKFA
jgi:hypothetical protein